MKILKCSFKKVLVIMMIFIMLSFFLVNSVVHAKSKLPSEGDFYYSGTTKGTYTVTKGIFAWLLENLGAIVDWLLGMATMLVRMVFVGWTALIEMLLTWVLETTMNMEMEMGTVSATNVSANTNSSQNVTVEAIVFGLVPMFDINIFNLEVPDHLTGTGIDLTQYECENCALGIFDCTCNTSKDNRCSCDSCDLREELKLDERKDISTMTCTTCGNGVDSCECTTEGNPDCSCEMCTLKNEKNAVMMVKETVAKWYVIIRTIAIAAMLVVLIAIGIKLATASIGTDKALYKRMLMDWVAGMLILFSMHFIMLGIISLNDALVKVVREASISSVKEDKNVTSVEGSPSFNSPKKSNSNIEISLYEEVRTRAYDVKLTNGLTGMVMYATLVYFAVRFSIVYLRRYLTIIILTLIAPLVAVAYAIQKALTGKSSSFSTWLTEYVLNCIIQVVHAIIYASFVTMALKLSLESVSGMIIAFVIMNYMLKAEKLFKKIFKMSSNAHILDENDESGSAENIKRSIGNVAGVAMAAKPVGKILMKSPITQAAIGIAKAPRDLAVLGGALTKKKLDERKEKKLDGIMQQNDSNYAAVAKDKTSQAYKDYTKTEEYRKSRERALLEMNRRTAKNTDLILRGKEQGGYDADEETALREALYTDQRPLEEGETEEQRRRESVKRWSQYDAVRKANKTYKKATRESTILGIASAQIGKLLDYNNYFIPHTDAEGNVKVNPFKDRRKGKWIFDENTKKPVRVGSMGQLIGNQFKSENLLGFTEDDKKQMKEVIKFTAKGLSGVASTFIGLGTFVAHPKFGMPLLAAGVANTSTMLGKNKKRISRSKQLREKTYLEEGFRDIQEEYEEPLRKQRYTFSKFSSGSLLTMQEQIEQQVNEEVEKLKKENIKDVKKRRPKFGKKMEEEKVKPVGRAKSSGEVKTTGKKTKKTAKIETKPIYQDEELKEIPREKLFGEDVNRAYDKVTYKSNKRFIVDSVFGGIGEQMDKVSLHHFKQIDKQYKKEKQVAIAMISDALQEEFIQKYEELMTPNTNKPKDKTEGKDTKTNKAIDSTTSTQTPIRMKTRQDITDIKDIASIAEVAILEEASARKKDVAQIDIGRGDVQSNVKKAVESILRENNAIKFGEKVEDVVKDIDKEIVAAKDRLDKDSNVKKTTVKDILEEALDTESEAEFIKKISGFDVDADNDTNVKNQSKRSKESKTKGLTKSEEDKVVELLLLQKQMRELNQEAVSLKMSPLEANKRYEAARTFVLKEREANGQLVGERQKKKLKNKTEYGPVTDINELIRKL